MTKTREGVALSHILIGDLVTPHSPTDPFSYVASVVLLDGELKQVSLPEALGEYPKDPSTVSLDAERLDKLKDAASDTDSAEELLARCDEDTFIPFGGCGVENLRAFAAENAPGLLGDPALKKVSRAELPKGTFDSSPLLVVLILILLVVLLAAGAWIAVRVVSGY
jgi:hypothetical protein